MARAVALVPRAGSEQMRPSDHTSLRRFCTGALAAMVVMGCSPNGRNDDHLSLPTITLDRTIGTSDDFGPLVDIAVFGSTAVVYDRRPIVGDERVLAVDLLSGTISHRIAPPGEGPGEIGDSMSLSVLSSDGRPVLHLYDYQRRKLVAYELEGPTVGALHAEYRVEGSGLGIHAALLANGRLVISGQYPGHWASFYELDVTRDRYVEVARAGYPPRTGDDADASVAQMRNWSAMAIHPSRERVALAFLYDARVAVIDAEGVVVAEQAGPVATTATFTSDGVVSNPDTQRSSMAYVDVSCTSDYVVALFSGHPEPRWGEGDEVHLFRWDGTFAGAFALGDWIQYLDVDSTQGVIYGTRMTPIPFLYVFQPASVLRRVP